MCVCVSGGGGAHIIGSDATDIAAPWQQKRAAHLYDDRLNEETELKGAFAQWS